MITSFHGIGAYRGQRNPVALSRQLTTALSGVEICTANIPCGAFGAILSGDCRATFDCDVWSWVDASGNRQCENYNNMISPETQKEYEEFCVSSQYYCESWVSAYSLRGIFVKKWAPETTKKAAAIIARNRKVPLFILNNNQQIANMDFTRLAKISFK